MKYLDEMTDKELTTLAKSEKLFLALIFNRENIIKKLEKKGYIRKAKKEINEDKILVEEETKKVEKVKEIDFSKIPLYRDKSRRFYRNYPNPKLMRKLKKRYRFKAKDKEINFGFRELNQENIKLREIETEINKSKYSVIQEDIYFDKRYLPESYFVDEIVLMPKNPTTLYAYWEIREDTFKKLQEERNIVDNIVIKILKDGHEYKKIIRHERIGSHFINDVEASQNYEALIGYEDTYGNYVEISRSTQTLVPINQISNNLDLTWGTVRVDENTNQLIKYINSSHLVPDSEQFLNRLSPEEYEKYTKEVIVRMRQVGASETIYEIDTRDLNNFNKIGSSNLTSSGIKK